MSEAVRTRLSRKVVVGVLVGELILGVVLAVTIGALASIVLAGQQREATQDITNTLAAALLPVIADQQPSRAEAILANVMESAGLENVECVRVADSSGQTVITHGNVDACMAIDLGTSSDSLWAVLFESRLVSRSIEVDGLEVARVYVSLTPPPLGQTLTVPLAAAGVVLGAIMLVSVPWTLWLVTREVIEPLGGLERYASRIATGEVEPTALSPASEEIGRVQDALESMALQLAEQRDELRDSYAELEEAYASLGTAKEEIEQLARIKEDFVAVAAHEIRAPLATIRLRAEMLETGQRGALDEEALEAVSAIHSAAIRLGSITSDLMDSALLERGMLPIRLGTVWLDELVEEAVRDADTSARQRGISLGLAGELPEMVVRADSLRIRQVIDNLLSNAIKYSFENGEILVAGKDLEDEVSIEVSDTGPGIDEGARDRLFTLFGRIDFGDSRQAAGLGLGLAISASIVEAHGGTVTVRANEGGRGSVFVVTLPKSGPTEGEAREALEARIVQKGGSA